MYFLVDNKSGSFSLKPSLLFLLFFILFYLFFLNKFVMNEWFLGANNRAKRLLCPSVQLYICTFVIQSDKDKERLWGILLYLQEAAYSKSSPTLRFFETLSFVIYAQNILIGYAENICIYVFKKKLKYGESYNMF